MDISLRIVIPLLLFVLFIVDLGEGHNSCPGLQCGNGPPIRFPFRLKDRQPDQHSGHTVYAFPSDDDIDDLPILSCTKMYTVSSVPYDIWSYPSLELTWSRPKCGHCERKGKICRFENNSTDLKTECFDPDKDRGIVLFLPNFHFYNHTSSVSCQHILILSKLNL